MPRSEHVPSWYTVTAPPAPDLPELEGDVRADVVIVGAGYTGLSAALELAQRGYDVVVLEAHRVGWGASGRNGGQVCTGFSASLAKVERWVGLEDARKLFAIAEDGKALIRERVERHGIACDLKWGYLHAAPKARHVEELKEEQEIRCAGWWRARSMSAGSSIRARGICTPSDIASASARRRGGRGCASSKARR